LTDRETPDPLGFLFGELTDETSRSSAPTASEAPSVPPVPAPPADVAAAVAAQPALPVYRSRREMRAAGGYLHPAPAPTSGGAPETVGAVTASVPIVLPAASAGVATEPSAPAPAVPGSRRALREAQAAASSSGSTRPPRERRSRVARPERAVLDSAGRVKRTKARERISAAGVMVLVGGLFAALALPAYADSGSGGVALVTTHHGSQALGVDATLDKASTARDEYGATSASELRALYASALRQRNLDAFLASGSASAGNDYPWPAELSRNQGGGLSPLGYYYRECVDFVAWRLNRDAGASSSGPWVWTWSQLTPSGGNASQWKAAWLNHGWPTGTTPEVGAVAWFPGQNHVAYVSGILQSGQIVIDEYNMMGMHEYDQRVIDPSTVEFLYAPPR
jgi:surface antigen